MSNSYEDFENLVAGVFSSQELAELSHELGVQAKPYYLEPVSPSVEDMLTSFDGLLVSLQGAGAGCERILKSTFLSQLAVENTLHQGDSIRINGTASYITQISLGERGWGVMYEPAELFGDFEALAIAPWYDVPQHEEPEDTEIYLRPHGLLVSVSAGRIVYADGDTDNLAGITYVPLQHGQPELHRVIQAPSVS